MAGERHNEFQTSVCAALWIEVPIKSRSLVRDPETQMLSLLDKPHRDAPLPVLYSVQHQFVGQQGQGRAASEGKGDIRTVCETYRRAERLLQQFKQLGEQNTGGKRADLPIGLAVLRENVVQKSQRAHVRAQMLQLC